MTITITDLTTNPDQTIIAPAGPFTTQPVLSGEAGFIRYNTETDLFEVYQGIPPAWKSAIPTDIEGSQVSTDPVTRPSNPTIGTIWYNNILNLYEGYHSTGWKTFIPADFVQTP